MKMKRLVSAIAALAMSVSVFAGLGTVANAAEETEKTYYIGSESGVETFDNYTITDNWTYTTATNNVFGIREVTEVKKPEIGGAIGTTNPTYVSGKVLGLASRAKVSYIYYQIPETITNGVLYFNTDAYADQAYVGRGCYIAFKDSNGNEVLKFNADGNDNHDNDANNQTYFKGTTTQYLSFHSDARKLGDYGFHVDTAIDLDNDTATLVFDGIDSVNKVRKTETLTVDINETADIASIEIYDPTYQGKPDVFTIDNTLLYNETRVATETSVIINKVDTDGNLVEKKTVTGVYVGDSYSAVDEAVDCVVTDENAKYDCTYNEEATLAKNALTIDSLETSGNEITLVFDVVKTLRANTLTINYETKDGTVSETRDISDYFLGDTYSYGFPMYVEKDGKYYVVGRKASGAHYMDSVVLDTTNVTVTRSCTGTVYENVVFCTDLEGSSDKNADVRASKGSAYNNTAYTSQDLEPGVYTVITRFAGIGRGSTMTIGDKTVFVAADIVDDSWTTYEAKNVTVTEAAPLKWNAGSNKTYDPIDTILVIKTGDVAKVTIDAENATVDGITAGYIAPDEYTFEVKADLGYKVTNVTVGDETVEAVDGKYTITVDGDTAIVVTTEIDYDAWVFSGITGDEWNDTWQNANIFFTYTTTDAEGNVGETTVPNVADPTKYKTVSGFLVDDLGKTLPTFSGGSEIQFALKIQMDVADTEIKKIWLEKAENVVSLSTGAFDPDAEIDESEFIEIGDSEFDVE